MADKKTDNGQIINDNQYIHASGKKKQKHTERRTDMMPDDIKKDILLLIAVLKTFFYDISLIKPFCNKTNVDCFNA